MVFRPMKVDFMVLVSARIKFCARTKKVQHSSLTKYTLQKVPIWNCRLKKSTIDVNSHRSQTFLWWIFQLAISKWVIWLVIYMRFTNFWHTEWYFYEISISLSTFWSWNFRVRGKLSYVREWICVMLSLARPKVLGQTIY